MIRVFVDSGSSIKEDEKSLYNVEVIPLIINLDGKSYQDGIDLSIDEFYKKLIDDNLFPKTSLPILPDLEKKVNKYIDDGDEVIIITISSKISGTYNAIRLLFEDNDKVSVVDSLTAVGGIRLIVDEINRYRDQTREFILKKIEELIPRIKVVAVPETLHYLVKGGRLHKASGLVGNILNIKPLIGFVDGEVAVLRKTVGLNKAKNAIINYLISNNCDLDHQIIPSYTYQDNNLLSLIEMLPNEYKGSLKVMDNLDPAIACHWGPNAFGFIFISK